MKPYRFQDAAAENLQQKSQNRRRNEENSKFMIMAPFYWSRMSGPHCNCIDIPTVNIREPSFYNIPDKFINATFQFKNQLVLHFFHNWMLTLLFEDRPI